MRGTAGLRGERRTPPAKTEGAAAPAVKASLWARRHHPCGGAGLANPAGLCAERASSTVPAHLPGPCRPAVLRGLGQEPLPGMVHEAVFICSL